MLLPAVKVIVNVSDGAHIGQFFFPKSLLVKKKVFSVNGVGGKRAIRVYPPWDKVESKQAVKTKSWQVEYFIDLSLDPQLNKWNFRKIFQQG